MPRILGVGKMSHNQVLTFLCLLAFEFSVFFTHLLGNTLFREKREGREIKESLEWL